MLPRRRSRTHSNTQLEIILNGDIITAMAFLRTRLESLRNRDILRLTQPVVSGAGNSLSSWGREATMRATLQGISSGDPLGSRLFHRASHRCAVGLATHWHTHRRRAGTVRRHRPERRRGLALLGQVQEQPISLFLGLPVLTDSFEVFDPEGKGTTFEIGG